MEELNNKLPPAFHIYCPDTGVILVHHSRERCSDWVTEGIAKQKSSVDQCIFDQHLHGLYRSVVFKGPPGRALVFRTAACSAPRVRQSTERRPARSPKARWKFTASPSHCPATQTVALSRLSTAYLLAYR